MNFDLSIFVHVSLDAKDLILKMLCRDIDQRISAKEILEHDWAKFYTENEQTFSCENNSSRKIRSDQKDVMTKIEDYIQSS